MKTAAPLSRRGLLQAGAAGVLGSAGLVLGFHLAGRGTAMAAGGNAGAAPLINSWIRIGPDGVVTILCNTSEIGQGTSSSIPQIVAEELEVRWQDVRVAAAPVEPAYYNKATGNSYAVFGSMGVRGQFDVLRTVGAAAREMLIAAAAEGWGVPRPECAARDGRILHAASGRSAGYGDLAERAARQTPPAGPPLKPRGEWRLIGKDLPRLEALPSLSLE